jgi:hypothetical protein
MFCLRWRWEDGKEGHTIGDLESLATVFFSINQYWPTVKFALTVVGTGSRMVCSWLSDEDERRLPPEFGG